MVTFFGCKESTIIKGKKWNKDILKRQFDRNNWQKKTNKKTWWLIKAN